VARANIEHPAIIFGILTHDDNTFNIGVTRPPDYRLTVGVEFTDREVRMTVDHCVASTNDVPCVTHTFFRASMFCKETLQLRDYIAVSVSTTPSTTWESVVHEIG
jgi:hypothetical protein